MIPEPGQWSMVDVTEVFHNIKKAVDRQDRDIEAGISLEEDVASYEEILAMTRDMLLGPSLAVHVVNTAHTLMAARYPAELVSHPFEPQYVVDLEMPVPFTDAQQTIAKTVYNRRITSQEDLDPGDVPEVEALDVTDQIQVFVILFAMTGSKLAMLKHFTGAQ